MEIPGSRPRRTARVTAELPKRSRTSSRAASSAGRVAVERQGELQSVVVVEVADGDADEREAPALDQRRSGRRAAPAPRRGSCRSAAVASDSVCERVARVKSSKRSRSMTVRPTRPAAAHAAASTRSTSPTSTASMSAGVFGAAGRARAATRSSGAAGRRLHGPRVAVVRERVQVATRRPGRASPTSVGSVSRATSPTVVMPFGVQLLGGDRADAPQPLDRQRVEELRARRRAARRAGRRAWRRRSRPWRGTWCGRRPR